MRIQDDELILEAQLQHPSISPLIWDEVSYRGLLDRLMHVLNADTAEMFGRRL